MNGRGPGTQISFLHSMFQCANSCMELFIIAETRNSQTKKLDTLGFATRRETSTLGSDPL